jgi:hypothetical protein
VAAEREQPRLVAGDQRLERGMVAATHERDQALVRLQTQQGGGTAEARGPGVSEG